MRHFAVVGSGPAGFYTAEALAKAYGDQARIDILDRYPVPYGLIRFGVAPDHQSLKAVSKRYDKVAESAGVDFIGNVDRRPRRLGRRAARPLRRGDPRDRRAARPQARHSRRGSARRGRLGRVRRLVQRPSRLRRPRPAARRHPCGGHRQRQCRARLRADPVQDPRTSSKARTSSAMRSTRSTHRRSGPITILGRRGPHQIAMTPKELGELGHLEAALAGRRRGRFPAGRGRRGAGARPAQVDHDPARVRRHRRTRQAQAHGLRFLRQAARGSRATARPSGSSSSAPSWTRTARARGTGETYEVPASPDRQLHRLFDPADRRRPL